MKTCRKTRRILSPLLGGGFALLCAAAASAAPPQLSIVPGAGTVVVGANRAYCEFVSRPTSDSSPLTHTFLVRNTAKTALTVERVAVSCDCVLAQIAAGQPLPVTVAPGQTVPVAVSLSMHRLIPGTVSKSAWLYLRGGGTSGVQLEMRGTVKEK